MKNLRLNQNFACMAQKIGPKMSTLLRRKSTNFLVGQGATFRLFNYQEKEF